MAVKTTKTTTEIDLYPVRCAECGNLVEEKYFSLNPLLTQYWVARQGLQENLETLIKTLNIVAPYGRDILPEMPSLIQNDECSIPTGWEKTTTLSGFETDESNNPPKGALKPVKLTMAAIVAAYVRMTGFDDLYHLLDLRWKERKLEKRHGDLSVEDSAKQMQYASRAASLLGKQLKAGEDSEKGKRQAVLDLMDTILDCAEYEKEQDLDSYSLKPLRVGWRYKVENGRKMPYSLMVEDGTGLYTECGNCCCNHCHKPINYKLGAYKQRIIGVLGTPGTGKTTYIAALMDMIDRGGVTTATGMEESQVSSDITIEAQPDPQWKRVAAGPGISTEPGLLWRYQHGYPSDKTPWTMNMALSFLVKSPLLSEAVLYTLADIPGEAFYNVVSKKEDTAAVEAQQKLLYNCDALIMVVSSRQLRNAEITRKSEDGGAAQKSEEMVTSPSEVLTCCDAFLPRNPIPTAVVLTAADEIHGGNLRPLLHLAYDVRRCPPLAQSGNTLVYNAELMRNTSGAIKNYLNTEFGRFMETLTKVVSRGKESAQMSAFAVSSGTQCASRDYDANLDDPYNSPEQQRMRYREICTARFGVASPFLWLLACDGVLSPGQGDLTFGAFSDGDRRKVADMRTKCLGV